MCCEHVHRRNLRLCLFLCMLTMMKRVFVTVGTTKFDKLIDRLSQTDVLDVLHSLGFNEVQFQVGTGEYTQKTHQKIQLKYNTYFDNFGEEIDNSHLVISHAGAGTCLEVLKKQKPLIVVINEDLMDNHQTELAKQLAEDGYLKCCTVSNLKDTLIGNNFNDCKPYPKPDLTIFSRYLDTCMGFS